MQQYSSSAIQSTPDACLVDLTPPTFAGIATLVPQANGSFLAGWLAAVDPTAPITYEVYIKKATATGLFSEAPFITKDLSLALYEDADGPLVEGQVYYVGVRARDGVGNLNTNAVSLFATSSGIPTGSILTLIKEVQALVNQQESTFDLEIEDEDEFTLEIEDEDEITLEVEDCS